MDIKTASNEELFVPSSTESSAHYRVTTYGISNLNEWHASFIVPNSQGGVDYVLVIAAVTALIGDKSLSYESVDRVKSHLSNFLGVSRRFEMIGEIYGCQIYDDYAHHPTEVRAVLQAARTRYPHKDIWEDIINKLVQEISTYPDRETVVFTLGAGDITALGPKLLLRLKKKAPSITDNQSKPAAEVLRPGPFTIKIEGDDD
ncbi:hypothetical protein C5167_047983 [Papaver somniferum]|uniref:Mur ligase C-terminal domain-containing protein n=1 Tax=Papaver somniferum TaxID=3469 RepID=A0A4Y7KKT8_PAPSO|nr:hypothetical protein C5167_047983 [Papaver somniferum]